MLIVPKYRTEQAFKRISVALNQETYNGIKSLSAVTSTSITDYVERILDDHVKKNATIVQQVMLARRAYEESLFKVADEGGTKKAAE